MMDPLHGITFIRVQRGTANKYGHYRPRGLKDYLWWVRNYHPSSRRSETYRFQGPSVSCSHNDEETYASASPDSEGEMKTRGYSLSWSWGTGELKNYNERRSALWKTATKTRTLPLDLLRRYRQRGYGRHSESRIPATNKQTLTKSNILAHPVHTLTHQDGSGKKMRGCTQSLRRRARGCVKGLQRPQWALWKTRTRTTSFPALLSMNSSSGTNKGAICFGESKRQWENENCFAHLIVENGVGSNSYNESENSLL